MRRRDERRRFLSGAQKRTGPAAGGATGPASTGPGSELGGGGARSAGQLIAAVGTSSFSNPAAVRPSSVPGRKAAGDVFSIAARKGAGAPSGGSGVSFAAMRAAFASRLTQI